MAMAENAYQRISSARCSLWFMIQPERPIIQKCFLAARVLARIRSSA